VRGEVKDFRRAHESRRRQLPRALTVGLAAGLVAVVFRWALVGAEAVRSWLFASAHRDPIAGVLVPPLWGALLAGAAVYTARRYAPEASGSGIPHVKAVLHRLRGMVWQRLLMVKFVGGIFGMAAGLALGREGPTIQMGAGLGQMVSRWWQCTPRERQTLIAAGAGAGLAAAFNAPLAGLVFVLEELQRDFTPAVFTSAFVASVTADVVARLLTGQLPVFHMEPLRTPPLASLTGFLLLGLVTGVLGVVFNSTLNYTLDLYHHLRHLPVWVGGAIAGGLVGLAGAFWPQSLGGGQRMLESVLASPVASPALLGFLLLRFGMTMVSYGSGAPGGIFAPLL
jgi:CIC family chloride channel protein